MNKKIVTSQAELDAIPVDYNGRIIIKFGTPYCRAAVRKKYLYPVVAWGNSSVVARGNSQIVDAVRCGNIKTFGNARIVYNPRIIEDWAENNDIQISAGKIKLYKAVHKRNGRYVSDRDSDFTYVIGEIAHSNGFTNNPEDDCGCGTHMATASWACAYGSNWGDLALLELEADVEEVVVPLYETGKVRAPKAKVIREVPLGEVGLMGKILAKRRVDNG